MVRKRTWNMEGTRENMRDAEQLKKVGCVGTTAETNLVRPR